MTIPSTSTSTSSPIIKNTTVKNKLPAEIETADSITKALFLAANSKILDLKSRFLLILSSKKLKQNFEIKSLLTEKLNESEASLLKLEENYGKYLDDPTVSYLLTKVFLPSKTAQNGLTFVTKDEEANLCKKEQPEEILNVFRIIYTLINEKYDHLEPGRLIDNMVNTILPKIQVENLSKIIIFTKFI